VALIDASADLPSHSTYQRCFGSMTKAYAAIGYEQMPHFRP
jgi:hypothetical protein